MKKNKIEHRTANMEIASPRTGVMSGHAALYNTEYRYTITDDEGGTITVIEIIRPGAFTPELINRSDVRATLNHDANHVLARSKRGQGTMKLIADERGLSFEFEPTEHHSHIIASVERGDIDQCSYKYIPKEERVTVLNSTTIQREVISFEELYDICLATYPAYEDTHVSYEMRDANVPESIRTELTKKIEEKEEEDWQQNYNSRERELSIMN